MYKLSRIREALPLVWAGSLVLAAFPAVLSAQQVLSPTNLGTTSVGSGSGPQTLTFTGMPSGVSFTLVYGVEFLIAPSCNGSGTCTVQVTFQPNYPGLRWDAIEVSDTSGHLQGLAAVYGVGVGPQIGFSPGVISTLANRSTASLTSATINGVAVGGGSNIWVSDLATNTVYGITVSTGKVLPYAGNGHAGYSGDGAGAPGASLNGPSALAFDAYGDLFIADTNNNVIRKVDGFYFNITTVAGTGAAGNAGDGGAATAAQLNAPSGVAVDAQGNLYISDTGNNRVREVLASNGNIVNFAGHSDGSGGYGDGAATSGYLATPAQIALDASGNLYIADSNNHVIREVSGGTLSTVAGTPGSPGYSGDGGSATAAQLRSPSGVAVDAGGNIYIGDGGNQVIRLVAGASHTISTIAGTSAAGYSGDGGPATSAALSSPYTLALDPNANLFFVDWANAAVRKISATAGALTFPITSPGVTSSPLTATVMSTGNANLVISNTGLTGTNSSEFSQNSNCGTQAAGSTCTVTITFSPQAISTRTASITISDNAPGSPHSIALTGSGVPPASKVNIDSPSAQSGPYLGIAMFEGWAISNTAAISSITILIDGAPVGTTTDANARPDVCAAYPGQIGCPNVGWAFTYDTTLLPDGTHTLEIRANLGNGHYATASSTFTVANWASGSADPMHINIDTPNANTPVSGTALFGGWAIDDIAAISQVSIAIDGASYGNATYGGGRPDVCAAYPNRAGCPQVGWNIQIDTTGLADGTHTLAVTATSAGGAHGTVSSLFTVANLTGSNPIHMNIDTPNAQSSAFSGVAHFGGWAVDTSDSISQVTAQIDGGAGNIAGLVTSVTYGGLRTDVCAVYPTGVNCPTVGWDAYVDTTLLANGPHTLVIKAITAHGVQATAKASFTVSNPVAVNGTRINIDQPSAGSPLMGVTELFGWAINGTVALNSIAVSVDGTQYGYATATDRPDVCAAFPGTANCPQVGWSFTIDTTQLSDGPHTLTVTAANLQGNALTGEASTTTSFNVANWTTNNPMRVNIDSPAPQATLKGVTPIGGWAIDDFAAITGVSISVDGVAVGSAAYGGSRPDVCNAFPGRQGCPNVGWNYLLDTTVLADGTHTLDVTATSSGGLHTTVTTMFKVANLAGSALRMWIDNPGPNATLSGTAALVSGWALDSNAAISSVTVAVDGVIVGSATYGGVRPDVCTAFPNGQGCPNVGWSYSLDTTAFANGAHTVDITVTASNGDKATQSAAFIVSN